MTAKVCPDCGSKNTSVMANCFNCNADLTSATSPGPEPCADCGRPVSPRATACPQCARPNSDWVGPVLSSRGSYEHQVIWQLDRIRYWVTVTGVIMLISIGVGLCLGLVLLSQA